MKFQDTKYATDAQATPEQSVTPSTPGWVFALLIGLGLFMVGLVWWVGFYARPALDAVPGNNSFVTPQWQAMEPVNTVAIPTPTPDAIALAAISPVSISKNISETPVPLPTVTPTPMGEAADPRTAEISGFTTLRLELSGTSFASSGTPKRFSIEPRTHTLNQDGSVVNETWCLQMGVHLLQFDMGLALDPANQDLLTDGAISLRSGFCDNPGPVLDAVPVALAVPADAAARIAYSLHGEQNLLDVSDLLNANASVTVELVLTNPRMP